MKRKLLILWLFLAFCRGMDAQTVHPDYRDGMAYFQLKTDFPLAMLHVDAQDRLAWQDLSQFKEIFERYGVNNVLRPFHLFGNEQLLRTLELHFDRWEAIDSLLAELQAHELVAYAEKVPIMRLLDYPNDPYYGTLNSRNWKWHLDLIKADSAWMLQKGNPRIKVAVVDGFVWGAHPDLQIDSVNQCAVSYSSSKGYVYSVGSAAPPSSIAQNSSSEAYYASHGTHCAGLVGAINDNGMGVASIGGGVTLMGVSATTAQYPDNILYGMQGVQWAAEHGANVISLSYGGVAPSTTQRNVMQACYDAGIVVVAAAGNEGDENNPICYPAGYNTVISVASVDGDGKLSYFSQWGKGRADIASPGGFITGKTYPNVLSTTYCKSYKAKNYGFSETYYDGMQGTSMACPVAAGVVGLLLSNDSTLTPEEVKLRLQRTASPLNPESEHTIEGYGYINAYAALLNEHLSISHDSICFPEEAGRSITINVSSSHGWTLSGLPSWLSASTLTGTSGIIKVTFTTLLASPDSVRVAEIRFNSMGALGSKPLYVIQENQQYYFRVSRKTISLKGSKNSRDTFIVVSSNPWQVENNISWLTGNVRQVTSDTFLVTLIASSSNTSGKSRAGTLLIKTKGITDDTIYVVQKEVDYISLSSTLLNIGPAVGDDVSLTVYSNVNWTLNGTSTWVKPDTSQGADTAVVVFRVTTDNTTGATRNCSYKITNGTITKSVTIRQAHNLAIVESDPEMLRVSPNPTTGRVECALKRPEAEQVSLYDMHGRLLQSAKAETQRVSFDLAPYAPGIYLIRCGQATAKIIKK